MLMCHLDCRMYRLHGWLTLRTSSTSLFIICRIPFHLLQKMFMPFGFAFVT
uniref:Uncharacterized protein n=1 Tax=Rhizophora mucronata TaxID=61149 RepID=A0A2P2R2S8_RHIMU